MQTLVETLFLALAPIVAFVGVHFEPVKQNRMLDPYIYTGYIHNFHDLILRYGATYYSVRFGLILPARILNAIFGPEAGYFVFRYLLALIFGIPLYAVIKRYLSTPVAVFVYACSLSSPYLARALLWDHPDASGVPFLGAAICLILLRPRQLGFWDFLAGCCAGMAANSNVFTVAVLSIFVLVHGVIWLLHRWSLAELLCRTMIVGAGFLLICVAGALYYRLAAGWWDIFSVTWRMVRSLSQGGMAQWHVPGVRWTLTQFAVFVPVWLSLCCLAVFGLKKRSFAVTVMGWYGVAITVFYYLHQFVLNANTLQLFYYFSYAAPAVFLMLAVFAQSLWGRAGVGAGVFAGLAMAVTIGPWVLLSYGHSIVTAPGLKLFLGAAAAALALAGIAFVPQRRLTASGFALAAVVSLGIAFDSGFVTSGFATYAGVIQGRNAHDTSEPDVYRTSLEFIRTVPPYRPPDGHILFWYNNRVGNSINSVQATYLWEYSKLNGNPPEDPGLPALNANQISRIRAPDVRYLGLIGESENELQTGIQAIKAHQIPYREISRRVLGSGGYKIYWGLLELPKQ